MIGHFESEKITCLYNENAQCNPIWVSQKDGLMLAHFQTFQQDQQKLTRKEHSLVDPATYERCSRHCLPCGHFE